MSKLVLYGASGHCKVIIDILKGNHQDIAFVVDDNRNLEKISGIEVSPFEKINSENTLLISIGVNETRKKVVEKILQKFPNQKFQNANHTNAIIDSTAQIGEGTVVMAGGIINADTVIGKHCILNTKASIDHDNIIEDYVHISPGATLCGDVKVGEGTHIGANAVVIQGIKIGKWCTIGAGAVIIKDVPDFATVVGNPGIIIKQGKEK